MGNTGWSRFAWIPLPAPCAGRLPMKIDLHQVEWSRHEHDSRRGAPVRERVWSKASSGQSRVAVSIESWCLARQSGLDQ